MMMMMPETMMIMMVMAYVSGTGGGVDVTVIRFRMAGAP